MCFKVRKKSECVHYQNALTIHTYKKWHSGRKKTQIRKKKERKWMQKGMVSKSLDRGQLYIFLRLETGTISLRMLKAVIM